MKQIIVYGGSFNPFHKGHEAIVISCLRLRGYDEIWIMPSARRADKPRLLSDRVRLEMLKLYIEQSDIMKGRIKVSDFEIKLGAPSETIRTYRALGSVYPDYIFTFVFGNDAIIDMPNWRSGYELMRDLRVLIVTRIDCDYSLIPVNSKVLNVNSDIAYISSTLIRENIKFNREFSDMVPQPIGEYIKLNNVYN